MPESRFVTYTDPDAGFTVPQPNPNDVSRPAGSRVLSRGDELEIDDVFLEAVADRFGKLPAWLNAIDDPDAQRAAWGKIKFLPGKVDENAALLIELEDEKAKEAEALRIEKRRQAARYGLKSAGRLEA